MKKKKTTLESTMDPMEMSAMAIAIMANFDIENVSNDDRISLLGFLFTMVCRYKEIDENLPENDVLERVLKSAWNSRDVVTKDDAKRYRVMSADKAKEIINM